MKNTIISLAVCLSALSATAQMRTSSLRTTTMTAVLDSTIEVNAAGKATNKSIYAYNANGDQTLEVCYIWDNTDNDWIISSKSEYAYVYDADGNQTETRHFEWVTDWVLNSTTTDYWRKVYTGIETVAAESLSVYPNPTSGVVYVDNANGAEIKVYNLNGELLRSTRESQIDLSGYPGGVYLLRIGDETVVTKKIVVKP